MRRCGLVTISSVVALAALVAATDAGPVGAAGDEGSKASELAEAQFRVFLLTTTDLEPTDVTCTNPPPRDPQGDVLCFALVTDRDSVAAIATLTAPGQYTFTPINKVDVTGQLDAPASPQVPTVEEPQAPPAPGTLTTADEAVITSIENAIANGEGLATVLRQRSTEITDVSDLTFDETTGTLGIHVTTNVTSPDDRDTVAFAVTDTIAYLWEAGTPFRAEGATIQPRLEVFVDDTLYSTPYPVMVQVADYEIGYAEWLAIATTAQAPAQQPAAPRGTAKIDVDQRPGTKHEASRSQSSRVAGVGLLVVDVNRAQLSA